MNTPWSDKMKVVECAICHKQISSSYPGEWVKCDCDIEGDFIFIDQTEYYIRLGVDLNQIIHIK